MLWRKLINPSADTALSSGGLTLSYKELLIAIEARMAWLESHVTGSLAIDMSNGIEWILFDLAALAADIPVVPIPSFFTDKQRDYVLRQAGVGLIVTDKPTVMTDATEFLAIYFQRLKHTVIKLPRETAKITYTSGSTGQSKGVCLSTQTMIATARAISAAVNIEKPVHMNLLPLPTLLENVAGVYAPLMNGGAVYAPSNESLGFVGSRLLDARKLLQQISAYQPDSLIVVPELLMVLVSACSKGWIPPKSLQFIAVGGARVTPALLAQASRAGLPVFQGYGLSECGSVVALNRSINNKLGSIGQILDHVDCFIEDGELMIKGNNFLGYLGDESSWYPTVVATEDLVSEDNEQFLWFEGRRKNQLISSFGRNICPEWPESELLSGGTIQQAVVFGDSKPHCIAIISPFPSTTKQQLLATLNAVNLELPDYAQIKQVLVLDAPMTSECGLFTDNGRPNRKQILTTFSSEIEALYDCDDVLTQFKMSHLLEPCS